MGKKLDEALKFAIKAHEGQTRKITNLPYILHPMEVACIVGTMTDDENVLCAAVLHDTLEDTDAKSEDIVAAFGSEVVDLIMCETENKRDGLPKSETWKVRKEESLNKLRNATHEQKLLWLSDKLSNLRSVYISWIQVGDDVFLNFHQKDKQQHEWYYRTIAEYTKELNDFCAYKEYSYLLECIFKKEK